MDRRKQILDSISRIDAGVVFDASDLMLSGYKRNEVARVIATMRKMGVIRNVARGVYFKPKLSVLGLGEIPVTQQALIDYYSRKYDCHISGPYGYNLIGLTEQCAYTITLAGKKKFKPFAIENCRFNYSYSPIGRLDDNDALRLAILLDALLDPTTVPARTSEEVLKSSRQIIAELSPEEKELLRSLAVAYPEKFKNI